MISSERLLAELDLGYRAMSSCKAAEPEHEAHVSQFLVYLRDAFQEVIGEHGEILHAKGLESLCRTLQRAQRQLEAEGVPAIVIQRIEELRRDIRKRFRLEEGWEKPPLFEKKKPT